MKNLRRMCIRLRLLNKIIRCKEYGIIQNMEKIRLISNPENIKHYLEAGNQTVLTASILERSSLIEGNVEEKVSKIFEFLRTLKQSKFNKDVFRKRTASQIMEDGEATGCTDNALVFIALARACNIPAKYVEALSKDWLQKGGNLILGHVYASIFYENAWHLIDPTKRSADVDIEKENMVIMCEGSDSWDIGANNFDTLASMSKSFRNQYLTRKQ